MVREERKREGGKRGRGVREGSADCYALTICIFHSELVDKSISIFLALLQI